MALTRPRYSQIPDSDYKNSCRIVTTTNVSLTGSAPLTYDGVTLVQYDRVLVAGQTDKTQNGIYSVSTLGSGSNGTWVRSKDANANDRLTAGMNTFVEEGTYTGQFWHLLTPGPIVLGVTELIFGQITGNAAGTSSQVQYNSSGSIAGAANLRYDAATGNVLIGGGTVSTSNVTGALIVNGGVGVTGNIWASGNIYSDGSRVLTDAGGYIGGNIVIGNTIISNSGNVSISSTTGAIILTGDSGAGIGGNVNVGGNVTANAFYTVNGLFWAANGLAFSSGLEVSEINTTNTVLSNISTQVTSLRFDRDTGFSVTELDPGNVKISLGSSFKTWHVPGQADLVAAAEDEVTFFGNGIDITTNPTFPKAITFIANNSILEANIGAFYNYANANIGTLYLGNASINANLGAFQTFSNANAASQQTDINIINANLGAYQSYANANIGTLFLGNASTQANIGAYQHWANIEIGGAISEAAAAYSFAYANAVSQSLALDTINANLGAYQLYANANVGSIYNNLNTLNANIGAYQIYANANIGSIYNNLNTLDANIGSYQLYANANIGAYQLYTNANIGSYQLYANANVGSIYNNLTTLDANVGSYQLFANANLVTQTTNYDTLNANVGAFYNYANTIIGPNNTGNLVVNATTESVSAITGALVVKGGAGIAGNLYVTGNIYASNLSAISISTLSVTDPLLYLTASNPYPYNYDIGFFSHYSRVSGFEQHTGLARDYTTNIWGFFSNLSLNPGATVDWTEANIIYDTVKLGDLIVSNTTQSTSTTTGALRVAGGAGIAGELYIANTGDVSANIGRLHNANIAINANLGAYQLYANANVGSIYNNLNTLDANIGSYQLYSNANIGTLYLGNISTNANLGAFQSYSNANVGSIYNNLTTLDANIGSYQIYANANVGSIYNSLTTLDANIGSYQLYANANVGSIYNSLTTLDANIGSYQIYANANVGSIYNNLNILDANIGSYQTFANANLATQTTNYDTLNANIGAFYNYANTIIGPDNTGNLVVNATTDSVSTVTGALVVKGGAGIAGNIYSGGNIVVTSNVSANKFYTTDGIYWTGNGAAYAAGGGGGSFTYTASATAPGSPTVGDQWFDTTDGTLYEYIDDGDSDQWVDIQTPTFASSAAVTLLSGDVSTSGNISGSSIVITSGIFWSNGTAFASSTYSNVNVEAYIGANIGSYQIYANANAAAQAISINTIDANIGTLFLGNASTNANLGAYQIYANANIGTLFLGNASTNANIGTLFLGNASTNANLGAYQIYANATFTSYSNTNAAAYLTTTLVPFANSVSLTAMTNSQLYYVTFGNVTAGNTILHSGGSLTWNPSTQALVAAGSVQTSSITAAAGGVNVFNTTATTINMGGAAANVLIGTTSGTATNTIFGGTGITGGQATGNIYAGNIQATTFRFANGVNILSTVSAGTTYSNTNVAAYLTQGATIGSGTTTTNLVAAATTTSTSTTTGALVVNGGAGIAGVTMVGGNLVAASGATSSSVTTGALVVVGGTGISGTAYIQNLFVNQDMFVEGGFLQARSGYAATSTESGAIIITNNGGLGVTGNAYIGNELVVPGGGKITSTGLAYLLEKANVVATSPPTTVNVDMATVSVMYWTGNATANVTANIRGSATQSLNSLLATGQSITAVLFFPNGVSNYLVTTVKIDDTTVPVAYQGNAAPVLGNSNSMDIYSFTILKTASATYKIFGSQTQFMHPG